MHCLHAVRSLNSCAAVRITGGSHEQISPESSVAVARSMLIFHAPKRFQQCRRVLAVIANGGSLVLAVRSADLLKAGSRNTRRLAIRVIVLVRVLVTGVLVRVQARTRQDQSSRERVSRFQLRTDIRINAKIMRPRSVLVFGPGVERRIVTV
eukprot:scaffold252367_cov46-Prasinocladus_malaysianus.AAC.1